MNNHPLSLFGYTAVCIVRTAFLWRTFQKASPSERRRIGVAVIGAASVVLLIVLLHAF